MICKIKRLRIILSIALLLCSTINNVFSQNGDASPINITINAKEGLQFDLARFAVRPGANVRLTFKNADEMTHNFIVTLPGERLNVVKEVQDMPSETALKLGYVPKS